MAYSAIKRGVGITQRTSGFIKKKINKGLAVIAINPANGEWVGFVYLEVWRHRKYVANSGLIVSPTYRGSGVSTALKAKLFEYSRVKFPGAKLFSLTTSPAVRHVNTALGYREVAPAELLGDKYFMKGCRSWVDFSRLMRNKTAKSLYVAMVYAPLVETGEVPGFYKMKRHFMKKKRLARRPAEAIPLHY